MIYKCGFNLQEIVKRSCKDLLVSEYCAFLYFLGILGDKVDSIYESHIIDDINCKYKKDNRKMYISFLIKDQLESGDRIDLPILKGYSFNESIVDGNFAKKNYYYCNFTLNIDEIHDTIVKIKNINNSEKKIKKYNL